MLLVLDSTLLGEKRLLKAPEPLYVSQCFTPHGVVPHFTNRKMPASPALAPLAFAHPGEPGVEPAHSL